MTALLALVLLLAQVAPPAPAAPPAKTAAPEAKAAPVPPAKVAAKSTPEGTALAGKVQKFYEKTDDFSSDFKQMFKYKGSVRKVESAGTVQVKKPGFMRWDYTKPNPKLFVLDGKALYMFDPED